MVRKYLKYFREYYSCCCLSAGLIARLIKNGAWNSFPQQDSREYYPLKLKKKIGLKYRALIGLRDSQSDSLTIG